MGAMKNLAIDRAELDAWSNANEVNRLRNALNRADKLVALLKTRIRRQDGRRWTGWYEDHLWWAEATREETHDGA